MEYEISLKPLQNQKMSIDFNKKNPEYEISLKPVRNQKMSTDFNKKSGI
jgi:hypothetical protein